MKLAILNLQKGVIMLTKRETEAKTGEYGDHQSRDTNKGQEKTNM